MAGEVRIGGSTASVNLQGNDAITSDQTFTFPNTGGELAINTGGGGGGADAWCSTDAADEVKGSYNLNLVSKPDTGIYIYEFVTPMPDAFYSLVATSNSGFSIGFDDRTTTGFKITTKVAQDQSNVNANHSVVVHASSTVTPTYTWTRDGTTLKPANAGDLVSLSGPSGVILQGWQDGDGSSKDDPNWTIGSGGVIQTKEYISAEKDITAGGYVSANAFRCRQGIDAADETFVFNWGWNSPYLSSWIGDVNVCTFYQGTYLPTTAYFNSENNTLFGSNLEIRLDPDDPSKVLDVKESIRTVQSALYRLKAAVLIPDTSVDQLRLRILEALETITEEVD